MALCRPILPPPRRPQPPLAIRPANVQPTDDGLQNVNSPNAKSPARIYPRPRRALFPALVHNGTVYVSGQLPLKEGKPISDDITDQTNLCLEQLQSILTSAGSDKAHVLKLNIYISNIEHWPAVNACCREFFADHRPARAIIPVLPLNHNCLIELDCTAATIP
ncbi:hypothetical protein CCB80_09320 [Armatimonadetes bacterium Uphvl-Ar1]|nr:hypothetical protein CCB80_09320 [Armatimonadetes bacterium Uphvl-Ar1]